MFLDGAAEAAVKSRVASLETATGVEVVAAVIARADSYPEIPWKAFALGASLAALAATAAALAEPQWGAFTTVVETAVAVLAAGGLAALATVWITPLARLFVPRERREAEATQYAQALFLDAGIHRTPRRDGILLLVSLFEHEVVVLVDRGVRERVAPAELQTIVTTVTTSLAHGRLADALLAGLNRLEEILAARGFHGAAGEPDEVPESVIQRPGPS